MLNRLQRPRRKLSPFLIWQRVHMAREGAISNMGGGAPVSVHTAPFVFVQFCIFVFVYVYVYLWIWICVFVFSESN